AALNTTFRSSLAASPMPSLHEASAAEVRIFPASRGLDSWTRGLHQPLLILGTVVGVVLLIACVNVGNLMLVRGVARQKELSIRLALGSSRWRLVRGLLVESIVIAAAGGALGLFVGVSGARALLATMVAGSTRTAVDVALDGRLLGATLAVSVIAALLFSALPALKTARGDVSPVLKQVAAGAHAPHFGTGRILMAGQV